MTDPSLQGKALMSPYTLLRTGLARRRSTARRAPRTRGQSLVEFALVIPILLFLTLIALDFGRVYLGLHQPPEHGPHRGQLRGQQPDRAGARPPDADVQLQYKNQIVQDAAAINCQLPKDGAATTVVPTPTFTDRDGNGFTSDLGDTAEVQIGCSFGVITPGIANVVGGSVRSPPRRASRSSPSMTAVGTGGGGGGLAAERGVQRQRRHHAQLDLRHQAVRGRLPRHLGWQPDAVDLDVPGRHTTSTAQDPGIHTFTTAGAYVVTHEGREPARLRHGDDARDRAGRLDGRLHAPHQTSITPGTTVTFTDDSSPGGLSVVWTFGAGEGSSTAAKSDRTRTTRPAPTPSRSRSRTRHRPAP